MRLLSIERLSVKCTLWILTLSSLTENKSHGANRKLPARTSFQWSAGGWWPVVDRFQRSSASGWFKNRELNKKILPKAHPKSINRYRYQQTTLKDNLKEWSAPRTYLLNPFLEKEIEKVPSTRQTPRWWGRARRVQITSRVIWTRGSSGVE